MISAGGKINKLKPATGANKLTTGRKTTEIIYEDLIHERLRALRLTFINQQVTKYDVRTATPS